MSKFNKPMIIKQLIETTPNEHETKDSMVIGFAVSTKDKGVKEEKIYLDYLKPAECRIKIRNALELRDYTNYMIETRSTIVNGNNSDSGQV